MPIFSPLNPVCEKFDTVGNGTLPFSSLRYEGRPRPSAVHLSAMYTPHQIRMRRLQSDGDRFQLNGDIFNPRSCVKPTREPTSGYRAGRTGDCCIAGERWRCSSDASRVSSLGCCRSIGMLVNVSLCVLFGVID